MMQWFKNLNTANKIGLIGLLSTLVFSLTGVYQQQKNNADSNTEEKNITIKQELINSKNTQQTFGNSSPINNN